MLICITHIYIYRSNKIALLSICKSLNFHFPGGNAILHLPDMLHFCAVSPACVNIVGIVIGLFTCLNVKYVVSLCRCAGGAGSS